MTHEKLINALREAANRSEELSNILAAAERIRHADMTGVNLVRAVSKIAQLSPLGEPLARILGVTIDPYVV